MYNILFNKKKNNKKTRHAFRDNSASSSSESESSGSSASIANVCTPPLSIAVCFSLDFSGRSLRDRLLAILNTTKVIIWNRIFQIRMNAKNVQDDVVIEGRSREDPDERSRESSSRRKSREPISPSLP